MSRCRNRRDRGSYYFIPFGRYEGSRPAEYPANEVLIGREKPRAELLKHLFSAGRRGAYLITGHRGSGKTSFVRHCLNEYRDDVYQRYLQRNVGRAFFWDRLGQAALVAVLALAGLLLSQLLTHLLQQPYPGIVAVPLILFLTVVLGYPWIVSFRLLRVALEGEVPTTPGGRLQNTISGPKPKLVFPVLLSFGVLGCLVIPNYVTPQLALAHAVLVVAMTVTVTEVASFHARPESSAQVFAPQIPTDDPAVALYTLWRISRPRWAAPWLALLAGILLLLPLLLVETSDCHTWTYLLVSFSLLLLTVGSAHRHWMQRKLRFDAREASDDGVHQSTKWLRSRAWILALATCGVAWWARGAFATLAGGSVPGLHWWFFAAALLCPVLATVVPAPQGRQFNPRPRVLLLAKSYVCLLVGTMLLFPLLAFFLGRLGCPLKPVFGLPAAASPLQLFHSAGADAAWLALVVVLVLIFDASEFDWIVRPLSKMREDFSLHRSLRDQHRSLADLTGLSRLREDYKRIFRETFFYRMYSAWLPVLVVPVNLGFDILDQRLVVEAMLAGLRASYQRTFLRWTGVFTAVRRGIVLLALVLASIALGDHVFSAETAVQYRAIEEHTFCHDFVDPGLSARTNRGAKTGLWLACRLGGESAVAALHWSPLSDPRWTERPFSPASAGRSSNLLHHLLNIEQYRRHGLDIPFHTLLVFSLLGFTYLQITRRWGLPPYRQIDSRMGDVLDGLSRTLREESRPKSVPFSSWIGVLTGRDTVQQKEGGPFDPRTIELSFLEILRDMQDPRVQVPFVANQRISPPIPEVIFVFDELDKVGVGRPTGDTSGPEDRPNEPLDQERKRASALHRLFGDLKNTISSGEARFLFIGGRNLHDEWLADQTARRPLLTQIFDLELYVPSLLTDIERPSALEPEAISAFLRRQKFRADLAYRQSRLKRLRPWLTLWVEELEPLTFVQIPYPSREAEKTTTAKAGGDAVTTDRHLLPPHAHPWPELTVYDSEGERQPTAAFLRELLEFFAYRSKGNVKRLRELLEGFLDPLDSRPPPILTTTAGSGSENPVDCDHVLAFGKRDRFRIQLVSDLYRHLAGILDTRISMRDDKMPQAVLYLADFLLKFHRRGFAWSNVERVDELVHIHRAPDLRLALQSILTAWNDRFLQRIRNGLYDFRCTSEFARELEYVSRASEEELAALNFTLDESQLLKAVYRSRIEVLGPEAGTDFVAGLAELHEFDEEYELARSYLRSAIQAMDQRFQREMQDVFDNPVRDSFDATSTGLLALRMRLTWGITRIRLSLQVGMTYERARNLEYALLEYREARTLANALIASLSGWMEDAANTRGEAIQGLGVEHFEDRFFAGADPDRIEFLGTLKHLHVVFQPLFAEAWVSEKLMSGVDTATGLLETELWGLRQMLPFVNVQSFGAELDAAADDGSRPRGPVGVRHSTFALVMAELYNKAGDLLFFKGRQLVSHELAEEWARLPPEAHPRRGAEGYLLRALDHYCVSLHDLRRFVAHRRHGSADRYGLPSTKERSWPTIESEGWTDFMRRVAAGTLADIADAFLARLSYTALVRDLRERWGESGEGLETEEAPVNPPVEPCVPVEVPAVSGEDQLEAMRTALKEAGELVVQWFETPSRDLNPQWGLVWGDHARTLVSWMNPARCGLADWFALPLSSEKQAEMPGQLLHQESNNPDPERLVSSLMLSMVSARMLERSGYYEAAGQRFQRVASAVAEVLWWRLSFHAVVAKVQGRQTTWAYAIEQDILSKKAETHARRFFDELFCVAVLALEDAEDAFRHARKFPLAGTDHCPEIGTRIPAESLTAACSLGLAVSRARLAGDQQGSRGPKVDAAWRLLCQLTRRWLSKPATEPTDATGTFFRDALREGLAVRRYPILNRLHGLKILVDDAVLSGVENERKKATEELAELVTSNDDYDSRLHFTPLHLGATLALAWLVRREWLPETVEVARQTESGALSPTAGEIRRRAQDALRTSQQMYTQHKGYYDAISNLYYLYDDFNDRCIHYNHAIQMAGSELATFLLRNLEEAGTEDEAPPSAAGR